MQQSANYTCSSKFRPVAYISNTHADTILLLELMIDVSNTMQGDPISQRLHLVTKGTDRAQACPVTPILSSESRSLHPPACLKSL